MKKLWAVCLLGLSTALANIPIALGADTDYEVLWRVPFDEKAIPEFTTWPSDFSGQGAYTSVLPVCNEAIVADCLQSVAYKNSQGEWISGEFQSYFPVEPDYKSKPGTILYQMVGDALPVNPVSPSQLPPSGRSGLWNFPTISHSNGQDFLVSMWIFGSGNNKTGPLPGANVRASVQPISSVTKKTARIKYIIGQPIIGEPEKLSPNTNCYELADEINDYCTFREQFNSLTPIKVVVKLKKFSQIFDSFGSWFTARVSDPNLEISRQSSDTIQVTFSGTPIKLSSAISTFPATLENYVLGRKILKDTYQKSFPGSTPLDLDPEDISCFNPKPHNETPNCQRWKDRSVASNIPAEDKWSFYLWQELAKRFQIVPINENTNWSFSTSGGQISPEILGCSSANTIVPISKDSLGGLIASNATVIDPNPPTWNQEKQTLDFAIAGIVNSENKSGGTQFYELKINETLARCLWKIDLSTAQAQIQVLNSGTDEIDRIQTVTLSTKGDYLTFNVSGLNISSSIISVKIFGNPIKSQQALSEVPEPAPTATMVKTRTISCTKGKTLRTISGEKPVCPKGFKLAVRKK